MKWLDKLKEDYEKMTDLDHAKDKTVMMIICIIFIATIWICDSPNNAIGIIFLIAFPIYIGADTYQHLKKVKEKERIQNETH
jgi:FtsH-binding integral membrane protein